jgi:hypothetical protein
MPSDSCVAAPAFKPLIDHLIDHYPGESPAQWSIEYDRESCQLPHMIGFDHLRELLAEGTLYVGDERDPEPSGAMTGRAIDSEIKKGMQRAKLALSSGDRSTYDLVMVEVVALRKYRGQTVDSRGMVRRLSTPDERDNKAIASAICRAMAAIRKAGGPKIAAYLQANIQRDDSGWSFTGVEKWDTGPPTPMVYEEPGCDPDLHVEYHRPSAPIRGDNGTWIQPSPLRECTADETTYTETETATETLRRKWVAESTKRAFLSNLMRDVDPWWFSKPKR